MSVFTLCCGIIGVLSFIAAKLVFLSGPRIRTANGRSIRVRGENALDNRHAVALLLVLLGFLSVIVFLGRVTNWGHL